jgi:uncharacterized protein (TIGR02270 family)
MNFAPSISPRVAIDIVVRRHLEEVATRWWRRESAYIAHWRTRFDELVEFDQMIDAHLDGLLEAGSLGMELAEKGLAHQAPDLSGDIFAAYALALLAQDELVVRHFFKSTDAMPDKALALSGVFTWNDTPIVSQVLQAHLNAPNVHWQDAALAQLHAHGLSGGTVLRSHLKAAPNGLSARALRTAGECGRTDLLPDIQYWLALQDFTPPDSSATVPAAMVTDPHLIRFWAAWSCVLLGDRQELAIQILQATLQQAADSALHSVALRLLCLVLPESDLSSYLQKLAHGYFNPALLLLAIGWSGNVGYADWLIEQMRIPAHARMAGEAFRLITGFDAEENDAVLEEPPETASEVATPDKFYPWPDAGLVAAWWRDNAAAYDEQPRLLLGEPLTLPWLDEILDEGEQAHRELAALHRAVLRPGACLLPTHAHAMVQWQRLQQLKEISA